MELTIPVLPARSKTQVHRRLLFSSWAWYLLTLSFRLSTRAISCRFQYLCLYLLVSLGHILGNGSLAWRIIFISRFHWLCLWGFWLRMPSWLWNLPYKGADMARVSPRLRLMSLWHVCVRSWWPLLPLSWGYYLWCLPQEWGLPVTAR